MSTNGSFTPPVVPECAYAPRMTRVQAIALMFAGGLNPNCVVVITDGPVIGTTGNTSPTEIEMQPVSATDIGRTALVHTTFSAQGWGGTYDLNTGTIVSLLDDWNNFAEDEDPGAPTVHTQVPWHAGSALFSGNRFDTVSMPGWSAALAAGVTVTDNTLKGSTVNLTGFTGGTFRRNQVSESSLMTVSGSNTTVVQNTLLSNSAASFLGTGQLGFLDNTMVNGIVTVDAATTGRVYISENNITDNYRVSAVGYTGGLPGLQVSGNQLATGNGTAQLQCTGPGFASVFSNTIRGGTITLNGTGTTMIQNNAVAGSVITKAAASTAPLNMTGNQFTNATLSVGSANAGTDNNFTNCVIRGGTFTFNGPVAGAGLNALVSATTLSTNFTTAATATAGIAVTAGVFSRGSVVQNRTAGGASLYLRDCTMIGENSNVTDNGTVNTGNALEMHAVNMTESVVTFGDMVTRAIQPPALFGIDMMASTLNITGLGSPPDSQVRRGRMQNATVTNAGYAIDTFEITGVVRTLTANQTNRLVNVSYDNLI